MSDTKYTVKTACPECGCVKECSYTGEEMRDKYGNVKVVSDECGKCLSSYENPIESACKAWGTDCHLYTSSRD